MATFASMLAGDDFFQTDTGLIYRYSGAAWVKLVGATQLTGSYPADATPWTVTGDSTANAAKTITKAAVASKSHYITAFEVVISAAAAGADITVLLQEDAAGTPVTYWKTIIGNASPRGERVGITFPLPIKLTANKTADLVVSAGGASCVTSLNLSGYTL